jgi:hypothetical protein
MRWKILGEGVMGAHAQTGELRGTRLEVWMNL